MGFFKTFLTTFALAFVGLGIGWAAGQLTFAAGTTFLGKIGKIAAVAAAIAGATATAEQLAEQDPFEAQPSKRSITFSYGPAQYVYGETKVPGLITYMSEYYRAPVYSTIATGTQFTEVTQDDLNAQKRWIDFLYTIAHHPLSSCRIVYLAGRTLEIRSIDADGRMHFTVAKEDDMTDEEHDRLNREFKYHIWIYSLIDGDTSQRIRDRIPNTTCDLGGFTAPGFNPAAIMVKVRNDVEFWNFSRFNPRDVSFVVRSTLGSTIPKVIPDFYERFLGVPKTSWSHDINSITTQLHNWYLHKRIFVNGWFTSRQIERAFRSLTRRTLNGSIVYENSQYHIRPRMGAAPTKTITEGMLTETVTRTTRQSFSDYANTYSVSFNDRFNKWERESSGPVINTDAVNDDGREIAVDLGHFMFETDRNVIREYLARLLYINRVFQRLELVVFMADPPQIGERVNIDFATERVQGIFIVEQRANVLTGVTLLTLAHDPDEVYTATAATLPDVPRPTVTVPITIFEPSNLAINETYDYVEGRGVIDVELSWTNPPRNDGAYIEVLEEPTSRLIFSGRVQGNKHVLQDQATGTRMKALIYGVKDGRRSSTPLRKRFTVGDNAGDPPVPGVLGNLATNVISAVNGTIGFTFNADQYTTNVEISVAGEGTISTVTPGKRNYVVFQVPETVDGFTTVSLVPVSPWGTRGPAIESSVTIDRQEITLHYYLPDFLNGESSRSNNSLGVETDDLIIRDNCITIAPNKPFQLLTGADLISNNPDVVPYYRKTMGTFHWTTIYNPIPAKWQSADITATITFNVVESPHSGFTEDQPVNITSDDIADQFRVALAALPALSGNSPSGGQYPARRYRGSGSVTYELTHDTIETFRLAVTFPTNPSRPYKVCDLKVELHCVL